MDRSFYMGNRQAVYDLIGDDALVVLFAGDLLRKSADAYYPFYAERNFVYLTGLGTSNTAGFVFIAEKSCGNVRESIYLLPPDEHQERWMGVRVKPDEARALSGIEHVCYVQDFEAQFHKIANSGSYQELHLVLDRLSPDDPESPAFKFSAECARKFPAIRQKNLMQHMKNLRTIKQPCEIDSMRKAMLATKAGILAMMKGSRPGLYVYQYKAMFDKALTDMGVIYPGFQSIISAGKNNFCIHYDQYTGQAQDGDMILNDVGACWDFLGNDVSRGFPVSGRFNEKQRLLYTCAYNTSEHMFSIIKPGMPMADVDKTARRYCFEQLKGIGLVDKFEDVGKYIWHGGAHHVGFDTHDAVDMMRPVEAGMVFCVDIGIYCEEWGIGFRLEDNCLVTEDGCENLSRDIPRSIEEIEAAMA